jgi:dipeptidyl-peptidase-4
MKLFRLIAILFFIFTLTITALSQSVKWANDGNAYLMMEQENLIRVDPKTDIRTTLIKKEQLIPQGKKEPLVPENYIISSDNQKILLFCNTARVWRYNTRGDYWLFDMAKNKLSQLGKNRPAQSLMFAKFSPDGKMVAYVSERNIYCEDVQTGIAKKLTNDGTRKLINGTFDWVYEEEFGCRDGFRWSPDGKHIAFWQIDANQVRDYNMLNATDSVYSRVIPVEYPKVGQPPSPARIGVVAVSNGVLRWMNIEGDPKQHYITRMEWADSREIVLQQLDRKQQESKLIACQVADGSSRMFFIEGDNAWVDLNTDKPVGWNWVNKNQDFLWVSEKDGWRHIYKMSRDGKTQTLLTKGSFDIDKLLAVDEGGDWVYFTASPENPAQRYLYRVPVNNLSKLKNDQPELVSNAVLKGIHKYTISPNGKIAFHQFSNYQTPEKSEWISLPDHKPFFSERSIAKNISKDTSVQVDYFQVQTIDNITLDAWMRKPVNFDPSKKYPLVIYVYGEPAATTIDDEYGNHDNFLYDGNMSADGYIQVALDNRGTPSLKGAAWRKAIYRRNGQVNIRDMAMGIKKIEELPFIDKDRTLVWGWSGGGSSTLHLLFRFPDLFKAGISIAPVTNLLYYDNIYTERYMGLPQENMEDFIKGSAITYAKDLKGDLLLIHGSGDDNVHYSNAETLINELIKYNKPFQFMEYPNRTHSISEGEGTRKHLSTIYSNYLREHCKGGGK